MADGKYFQTTKKGEIHELKEELNSVSRDKIKEAVRHNRINIQLMTSA